MAMIVGKPEEIPEPRFIVLGPQSFRDALDSHGLSVRDMAQLLGVSHMWVQRRARGEVDVTREDSHRIRRALEDYAKPINQHPHHP